MTEDPRPTVQLRLLGAPEIFRDGRLVTFDTRKATALLAYLAETGRRHTREDLAALLWPESDRTRARSALRRTLSSASAVGPALIADRAGLWLDLATIDADVRTFAAAPAGSVEGARRAVGIYRGDFLEGFTLRDSNEFEDWRAGVQDRLRRELDRHLALLVDHLVPHGELDEAIDLAGRRLQLDPLNESAHQSLMALYEWNGQRSESLRQYRRCVRALERELGVSPLPETTAVYDAVRRHRLQRPGVSATGSAAKPEAPARAGVTDRRPTPRTPARVFVGRATELEALAAGWRRAREGGYSMAVVGEVGSGKTALLTTFAATLERDLAAVGTVRGHEGEQGLAYGAATDLVRLLVRADAPESAAGDDRGALAWLSPAGKVRPAGRAADRTQVFDAVRTVLVGIGSAASSGALLVIEDVHWLDPESADLVAYLLRRPAPGVLILVSWRGTSSPMTVAAAVAETLEDGSGSVLRLGPLSESDVAEVLAAHGQQVDAASVRQVETSTGGLPLLVTEAARAALADVQPLPGDLDALVRARIDAAPETTRQVLTAVAVVGAPLDPELLRAVSGRSDQEVVTALDDAVARGLLVELRDRGEYDLPHGTLRRLATAGASAARRRLLHSRAADALAGHPDRGAGRSAAVARHLELAGRTDEAAAWHVQAAEQAAAVSGHATAELHWEASLALGYDRWAGHVGVGDARLRLGRYRDAIAAYEQAAAAATADEQLALVEHRLGGVHDRLGEYDVAEAHLEAALALLEGTTSEPARSGRLLADLALVSLRLGDTGRALDRAGRVIESDPHPEGDAALAQAYDVLGVAAARTGDLDTAREHLRSSLVYAARSTDPAAEIAALNNLARVEARAGQLDEALTLAGSALDRSVAHADTHRTAALHDHLADLLHQDGRDEEAREHQRAAASLFAAVDRDPDRRAEIWQLAEW